MVALSVYIRQPNVISKLKCTVKARRVKYEIRKYFRPMDDGEEIYIFNNQYFEKLWNILIVSDAKFLFFVSHHLT